MPLVIPDGGLNGGLPKRKQMLHGKVGQATQMLWRSEKYSDVLTCDVEGRNALDAIFPIDATEFGELPESGYFFSEFHRCYYNEDSSKSDAVAFLPEYTAEVMANAEGFCRNLFSLWKLLCSIE